MGKTEYLLITIVFNFLFILFIVAIISYVWQYKRKKREHLFAIQNQQDVHQKELLAIQLEIQEKTMQEIGREIHDNIGQKLTLASLYIQNLLFESKKPENNESIANINTIINDSLADLRQLSKTLTDDAIASKSLVSLLQSECQKIEKLKKCSFTYDNEIQAEEVTYYSKSMFLRIAQEFIQNSLKHAQCKTITINLSHNPGFIVLELSDDGQGFDVKQTNSLGIGLQNMKKRTETIGGQFLLESSSSGTNLTIKLPLSV
ncbi:sensor histidine kinase [Flavobacterium wongokense]|uniref:sensor histidine kinase n=1 Tax=Flavobacterium wongokense TaxID=2910674 RepID=UPI001F3CE3DF|nr:ATP-binding protein [Flavobacterium sp. WG47]MCF6132403.1 histidine kinase [Flavobacterium sp. WG47]